MAKPTGTEPPNTDLKPLLDNLQVCLTRLSSVDSAESADLVSQVEASYQQIFQAFNPRQYRPEQQPYVTEFHKQLRLLGTDVLFLKSARQAATRTQRLKVIGDRLQALQGYYSAISNGPSSG
ncbi:MAG: heterocyst frequency control protein PatD [Elainellaceae cyanobacterium]